MARPALRLAPTTKAARQSRIVELLRRGPIRSQSDLAAALAAEGVTVTQATLSRDLVELGAEKARHPGGGLVYVVPSGDPAPPTTELRLARVCEELLISAEAAMNQVVLRTPPGAAQFLASALDRSAIPDLAGTIAGDDTILLVCRSERAADRLAHHLLSLAEGRS